MLRSTKKKLLAALILCGIAIGGFGALWYAVFSFKGIVASRAEAALTYSRKHAEVASLEKMLEDTKADRAELLKYIVTDEEVTSFLELVEHVAREQGLLTTTRSISVEPMKESSVFEVLSLTLDVEGSHEGVIALTEILETLPYQVGVPSVTLEKTSESSDDVWHGVFLIHATKEKKL